MGQHRLAGGCPEPGLDPVRKRAQPDVGDPHTSHIAAWPGASVTISFMTEELPRDWTVLALETSCDETAAAVIRGGRAIVSNEVASQMHLHERYGGVVPEVASREHILNMAPVIEAALAPLPGGWDEVDAVACTYGPGLAGEIGRASCRERVEISV